MKKEEAPRELHEFYYLSTNDSDIIYILLHGHAWSAEELRAIDEPLSAKLEERIHEILAAEPERNFHILVNALPLGDGCGETPGRVSRKRYSQMMKHPQIQSVVFVTKVERVIRSSMQVIAQLAGRPLHVFGEFEEAVAWLEEHPANG